ncbi:hypothetical protein H7K45_27880 [Mycobacterium yunnanensis]|uniref:Uncharacterized protein n=1 Tax=Mycobacterium yunnanensis TaxID=368477 RepID=A0A9X3C4E5_9MYCO|nr:hypothetical protein [Mycobacterium yunnanensis]MCV7424371.1 hypothetical protein [Mycobacterium yunnanensis]
MEKRLSDHAEALYAEANFRSVTGGHEGFIPDHLLSELEDYDPEVVQELVDAGRWDDETEGYRISNTLVVQEIANKIANDPTPG